MSSNLSKISFYSLIAVLVSITTVALPEVQAAETQPIDTSVQIFEDASLVFTSDYSQVLSSFDETTLETLEKVQQQESKKIKDELERIRLEEERKRREAEEAARLAAIRAAQQKSAQQTVTTVPSRIGGNFEGAIQSRCAAYGCNSTQVIRVMYCESGGRSNAVNGIHKGLFQFNPNTFAANANRVGINNPDIWDPYQQITVATWMFANGQAWQWSCK